MSTSKTDAAILGMLTTGPMSGYDMKRFCEQSLSFFWHESYGNLYPRLKRLRAARLIAGRRQRRQRGPDAIVYSLTAAGRRRFREWMQMSPEPEHVRSEFLLKVFFGALTGPALAARWIREHQQQQEQIRAGYVEVERMLQSELADRPETAYWLLTLRRGQLLTEARLRWCRESLELLEEAS